MYEVDARTLIEESPEAVVLLARAGTVLAASRPARQALAVDVGAPLDVPDGALVVPVGEERLVYLRGHDAAAYEELRSGFTAAVSHELRTPLARLYSLLETALLPGEDTAALVEQARDEVDRVRELIDEILFLSELESGARVVALGATRVLPVLREVADELEQRAARAGVTLAVEGDEEAEVALRPRMIRVVALNLTENAIRYAGPGATFRLSARREDGAVELTGADDGAGVLPDDLPRLFERFYRGDRARASRGTGLGLAIVKHVVAAAGGTVEARSERGRGLEVRCAFPTP